MPEENVEDLDMYALLGIEITSTVAEIKKAYRKKALECHPDKNPDNPNAGALFRQLSKILQVLTDETARKVYDRVLRARKAAEIRHRELDGKRKKLKEDLEEREKRAFQTASTKSDSEKLKEEIERLRKEGSRAVQEEMDYVMREVQRQMNETEQQWNSSQHRIKIKWNVEKGDQTNGGYTEEMLHRFLIKYGDLEAFVMSSKKRGSALVEFKTRRAAEMAVDLERGLAKNPITLEWLNEAPKSQKQKTQSTTIKETDFESLVLHRMRQAEERKRLIEQMKAEDEG